MNAIRRRALATALCVVVVVVLVPAQFEAQSKCLALKFKTFGAIAKVKARCYARAAKAGTPVDSSCLAAADAKLALKWAKAEGFGDCAGSGDAAQAASASDQCVVAGRDVITPLASPCCNLPDGTCGHGIPEADCSGMFGGTLGAAGSICSGATGSCGMVAPAGGRCCMTTDATFCIAGPALDLSGCFPPNFLGWPFNATCASSGACTLLP